MTNAIRLSCALFVCVFLLPIAARAQTPIVVGPSTVLAWEIDAPDVATARGCGYNVAVDAATPIVVSPVSCGPGPGGVAGTFTCSTPIAQIPTGSHTLAMTDTCGGVTSLPSAPLTYVDMLIPVPKNLRIKQ
jgi:hypothetical protein